MPCSIGFVKTSFALTSVKLVSRKRNHTPVLAIKIADKALEV